MAACALSPSDKRTQARKVGNDLVRHYGKQRYYTVQQVQAANKREGIDIDLLCWSHAMFNTHEAFDKFHESLGEQCDYSSMKCQMLEAVSEGGSSSWFDFDLSWLEFPDLDGSLFDFLDF